MTGLEQDATKALRALAAVRTPGDGAMDRAWVLMQQRIVDGPPPIEIGPVARPRPRWIAMSLAVAAVLVVAVGLASWRARWVAAQDDRPAPEAPYSATQEPARQDQATPREPEPRAITPTESSRAIAEDEPLDARVPAKPEPQSRTSAPRRRAAPESTPVEPPAPKGTTLAAEMRLLAKANSAMRAGDPAAALRVLDEHAKAFADGQLAPEREYKRAVAMCELGKTEQSRSIASAFVRAHPRSPLRAKAESVGGD